MAATESPPSRAQSVVGLFAAVVLAALVAVWLFGQDLALGWSFLAGLGLAALQRHPVRAWGLVPWGITGLAIAAAGLAVSATATWPRPVLCFCCGVVCWPFGLSAVRPPTLAHRPLARPYLITILLLATMAFVGLFLHAGNETWALVAVTASAMVVAWLVLVREALEEAAELPYHLMYRMRVLGAGPKSFPRRGAAVVIANHSAFCDPLWVGKVVPRLITPMMTRLYYDRPGLHFLMHYIVRPIRVNSAERRAEAPELQEAVRRLDQNECLVIFPEGKLRRREDRILQHFGQGPWHILKDRPDTPVVACWINGGWGSFFSYKHGPPGSGKPFDIRRRITVIMGEPFRVPAEVLATQQATRRYLMDAVLAQRALLPAELQKAESEVPAAHAAVAPVDPAEEHASA